MAEVGERVRPRSRSGSATRLSTPGKVVPIEDEDEKSIKAAENHFNLEWGIQLAGIVLLFVNQEFEEALLMPAATCLNLKMPPRSQHGQSCSRIAAHACCDVHADTQGQSGAVSQPGPH